VVRLWPGPLNPLDETCPSTSRGFPVTATNQSCLSIFRGSPVLSISKITPARSAPAGPLPGSSSQIDPTSETTLHPNVKSLSLFADPETLTREEVYVQEIYIRAHYGGFDECRKPSYIRIKETPSSPVLGIPARDFKKQKQSQRFQ